MDIVAYLIRKVNLILSLKQGLRRHAAALVLFMSK